MLLRIACCLLALSWLTIANAEIYKSLDKNGNPVYTDRAPSADSEQLNLPSLNSVPGLQVTPAGTYPPEPTGETPEDYQIRIISPRADVTIPPGQRDLAIAVEINRAVDQEHLIAYFLNGTLLEETNSTSIIVRDVTRGSHQLLVEIIDKDGNTLGRSDETTVNVIRPSIIKPKAAP